MMAEDPQVSADPEATEAVETEATPLLSPAEGVPEVCVTAGEISSAATSLAKGSGPFAIDAERASGFRYSNRAYPVQIRRAGSGTALYFMHGNRDFLLGEDFAARCDLSLLAEPTVIDLYGRPALLLHGDSLCTEDRDYMAFRAQVRNPLWQQAVLARPLAERRQLASALRSESMKAGQAKDQEITDVTPAEVDKIMADLGVDLMIHGHTHRPARHTLSVSGRPAERIVLGDWDRYGWYLRAEPDGALDLVQFPLSAA